MFRHLFLPVAAAAMFLFATIHALYSQRPDPNPPPPVPPPTSPFGNTVAGAGMVEPSTEASGTGNIAVGSQLSGTIAKVCVRIGQEVKAGDLLFELDPRLALADLNVREETLAGARAQLRRLELQPRPEEVPASEAQVKLAGENLRLQRDLFERGQRMGTSISPEDLTTRRQMYQSAIAQLDVAKANLALLKAGAWEPDKVIAYATVEQARASVEQARTTLEVMRVRAPVAGCILQVNVRPGEYVTTAAAQALVVMGNLRPYHVRVSVDEEDIPRLRLNAPARAKLRGDMKQEELSLRFVRLEPYVVPKTSLTGANTERVDTRVVQVIYALDPDHRLVREKKVLVGQLVNVFIDTRE